MSNKTDIVLVVSTEEIPYFLKNYDDRKAKLPNAGLAFGAHPNGWVMRLTNVTTREVLEFCANVYAEIPEEVSPVRAPEEAVSEAAELMKEIPFEEEPEEDIDEDDAAEEEEESEEDFSNTPEGREVKAKLKKVRVAAKKTTRPSERRLAEAANVVTTDNKSVTIEGS